MNNSKRHISGFTLVEIVVALGLFSAVMTMASGAYLIVIRATQEAQSISTGINNLSFALETMARLIRTGTDYACQGNSSPCSTFTFTDMNGRSVTYAANSSANCVMTPQGMVCEKKEITKTVDGVSSSLTDRGLLDITSLRFYVTGALSESDGDPIHSQPNVRIVISGTIPVGPNRPDKSFTIETSATMRGVDL